MVWPTLGSRTAKEQEQDRIVSHGARLEGPKFEPEGPRAEVGFPTTHQGFPSVQGTLFGFYGIEIVFDACNIYPHQAWTSANDKMTAKDYIFFYKTSCIKKNTQT